MSVKVNSHSYYGDFVIELKEICVVCKSTREEFHMDECSYDDINECSSVKIYNLIQ